MAISMSGAGLPMAMVEKLRRRARERMKAPGARPARSAPETRTAKVARPGAGATMPPVRTGGPQVVTAAPQQRRTGGGAGVSPREHAISQGPPNPSDPHISWSQPVRSRGAASAPDAGPGTNAQGLPTMDSVRDLNRRFRQGAEDLLAGGHQQDFEGVAPGSGELGPDFDRSRSALDAARRRVGEFSPMEDSYTSRLLAGRSGGGGANVPNVDRVALAKRAMARFQAEREPDFQRRLRDVGAKAAALGRTGAGMTTNDLTGVLQAEGDAERRMQEGVLDTALGASVDDAMRRASLETNRMGTLGNLDIARSGQELRGAELGVNTDLAASGRFADLGSRALDESYRARTEGRTERDARNAYGLALNADSRANIGLGSGISDQILGQEAGIRGERNDLAQQAIDNNLTQLLTQDRLSGNAFNRTMDRIRLMMEAGQMGAGQEQDVLTSMLT